MEAELMQRRKITGPESGAQGREQEPKFSWPGAPMFESKAAVGQEETDPLMDKYARQAAGQLEREKEPMSLRASINKEALTPELVSSFLKKAERYESKESLAEKHRNLEAVLDRIRRLPEQLVFQPGITLIVGDNGSGKSTLARALFYAARYEAYLNDGESRETAHKMAFEPHKGDITFRAEVSDFARSGMAPHIAQQFRMKQTGVVEPRRIDYEDLTTVSGEQSAQNFQDYQGRVSERRRELVEEWQPRVSNRQTIDQVMEERARMAAWRPKNKTLLFVDEPEIGMSPRRQKQLKKDIEKLANTGSVEIVVTNSVALYDDPDVPRIDLDFPERGVFRPRDYLTAEQ